MNRITFKENRRTSQREATPMQEQRVVEDFNYTVKETILDSEEFTLMVLDTRNNYER